MYAVSVLASLILVAGSAYGLGDIGGMRIGFVAIVAGIAS
jgi:hypothetical protein